MFKSSFSKKKCAFQNEDVSYWKKRLRDSEASAKRAKEELHTKTKHFEETVIHLKEKLVDADNKMKRQRAETDTQMKSVINRLLNVESELRNEHTEMEAVIVGKQKLVDIQERRIKSLEASNARLMDALSHLKEKYEVSDEQIKKDLDEKGIVFNDPITPVVIAPDCENDQKPVKQQQT